MSGVLERAAGFFLAPAAQAPAARTAVNPTARTVVLGTVADAVPLAAALAMSPRPRGAGAGAALVAVWSPDDGVGVRSPDESVGVGVRSPGEPVGMGVRSPHEPVRRAVATRAATQLAARLDARELRVRARGRLVWLELPADPPAATAAVRRASALVDGPLVTALCGARPPGLDGVVAEHDVAVVAAPPDTPLARAAVAQLAGVGVSAAACAPLPRGLMRALALAGVAGPRLPRLHEVADGR